MSRYYRHIPIAPMTEWRRLAPKEKAMLPNQFDPRSERTLYEENLFPYGTDSVQEETVSPRWFRRFCAVLLILSAAALAYLLIQPGKF